MAIEHSQALLELEAFYAALEPKLVPCAPLRRPVYARPITAQEFDKLVGKYSGLEYNVRLMVLALQYENASRVFMETDLPRLLRTDPAIIAETASAISLHVMSSFDSVKNS